MKQGNNYRVVKQGRLSMLADILVDIESLYFTGEDPDF